MTAQKDADRKQLQCLIDCLDELPDVHVTTLVSQLQKVAVKYAVAVAAALKTDDGRVQLLRFVRREA